MTGIIYSFIGIIFLCAGSFLNVVIYRLPKELSLLFPGSYCRTCRHKLYWHQNIPVLSYLYLKGKCYFCRRPISYRYIFIELLTGLTGLILYYRFGLTPAFIAAAIFSCLLIMLIFIDIDYQILPDNLTLLLLWLGLLISTQGIFISSQAAILGACSGYLSLWTVAKCYEKITGRVGMGYGDFKLLAALGAWTGWQSMGHIILLASLSGLLIGLYFMCRHKATVHTPLAFGPYLAIAGWIMLILPSTIYSL